MGGANRWPIILLVVFMLLFSAVGTGIAQGKLLVDDVPSVNLLGKGLYETVNEAVDASKDGDVVLVGPGEYDQDVEIDKSLLLIGNGPQTIYTATYYVRTNNVVVQGHTFMAIYDTDWNDAAGITTQQSKATTTSISNLVVKDCTFDSVQHGVYLFGATYATVEDCTFTDSGRGVSIQHQIIGTSARYSHHNTIQDNTFTDLVETAGCEGEAVAINDSDSNTIKNNVIDNAAWGVMVYKGDNNIIQSNTITNCTKDPIYICNVATGTTVDKNVIRDNKGNVDCRHSKGMAFTDNTLSGNAAPIYVLNSNSFTFTGNDINGSGVLLDRSTTGTFATNTFTLTDALSFDFRATGQGHYNHAIATTNTVNGNAIFYGYNVASPILKDTTAGSIMYAFCTDATVDNMTVKDGDGIRLFMTRDSNITANVTNCIVGIDVSYSPDNLIMESKVDTSSRGEYGIRMLESLGTEVHDSTIATTLAPSWRIEGTDVYKCYNTTFPYTSVSANLNGGGELWAYSDLTISIKMNETLVPMDGVDAHLTEDDSPVYSTSHFGGTDNTTDSTGMLGPFTLLDRVYKNFNVPIEYDHDLDLWLGSDDVWSRSINKINMSRDRWMEFETSDVWKPGMPGSFAVTDIPDQDALEITWDLNNDDTRVYSLWTNSTGDWGLLENVSFDVSSHLIDQGLIHGVDYWYAISAWDEVPLQSERTPAVMVTHVDGVAPATPSGFSASEVNGTDLSLIWDANTDGDLDGYRVYMNESGGDENGPWVLLTASTGFMDLTSETVYNFVITAIDERPNESPFSLVVTVTTDDITPPDAPELDVLPEWTNQTTYSITGSGEPGATLRLVLNGEVVDEVEIGLSGEFSVDVDLEDGANVLAARCIDPSGNMGDLSLEVSTILDTEAPLAPLVDPLPTLTNVVTHTVSGTAEAYSSVVIVLNGEVVDTIVTDSDGAFELELTLLEGDNTVTAYAVDRALNHGPRADVMIVDLDTIAPDAPSMDVLPEYTNEETHTITGSAEPGSTVELMVGNDAVDSAMTDNEGNFELTVTLSTRLTIISVRATDPAGNVGDNSDTWSIILDQEDPIAAAGEDGEFVEDTVATFDGSSSTDNEGIASYEWSFELDGTPMTLDGETGEYTFPDVVTLTVTLTVTDLAGNTGSDTMELTIISSNLPPTLRRDDLTPEKGHTNTKFKFTVEFKDPDNDNGEVWIYIDGESFMMTPDPEDTDPSDGVTYVYETKLTKGDHTYYFTGRDSFGNDAEGPSAGEDNAKASPDIGKKEVSDTPGPGLVMVLVSMLVLVAFRRVRVRRD
jgi:parallel beta-helix repeat protein